MGFKSNPTATQTILIQSTDKKISSVMLSQSADIISKRLKSFSADKFEIKLFPEKNQIQITVSNKQNIKITESLITQKGKLEFYETYDYKGLANLLKGDTTLLKFLNADSVHGKSARLICASADRVKEFNKHLNSAAINGKCRFAWATMFDDPEACLFALNLNPENLIPLTGADIESFAAKFDKTIQNDCIDFKFKKYAIPVWAAATRQNLGKEIAIVLDNTVLYAPFVNDEIKGGNCTISGDFTHVQVQYIVAIGSGGELPAEFKAVK